MKKIHQVCLYCRPTKQNNHPCSVQRKIGKLLCYREKRKAILKLTEIDTNSNITDNVNSGQNMPSYDPTNLDKNSNILSDGLKSLCSKGHYMFQRHLTIIV